MWKEATDLPFVRKLTARQPIPDETTEWFNTIDVPLSDVQRSLPSITPIATEFLIESVSGGSCVLRVVSSSYGTGADWEHEFWTEIVAGFSSQVGGQARTTGAIGKPLGPM